jgi:hypothetical protein
VADRLALEFRDGGVQAEHGLPYEIAKD